MKGQLLLSNADVNGRRGVSFASALAVRGLARSDLVLGEKRLLLGCTEGGRTLGRRAVPTTILAPTGGLLSMGNRLIVNRRIHSFGTRKSSTSC